MLTEIAEETGISEQNLGLYKRGKHNNPTIENVCNILDYFNVPMAYLDSKSEMDAIHFLHDHLNSEANLAEARYRNSQGMDLSSTALNQVRDLMSWVLESERAKEQGLPQPPLPRFTDDDKSNS
jgi:transcriptional regulator with XRE-family HTH domain